MGDIIPELPEVETFKKYIDATSLQKNITSIRVKHTKILERASINELDHLLKNTFFNKTFRHGKYIFVETKGHRYLILHFGMTGNLKYFKKLQNIPSHTRLLINFENGYHLAIQNQRLFGKIGITNNIEKYLCFKGIGYDAMKIDMDTFIGLFKDKTSMIKSFLMNQSLIAGIGNIYADEILFQSKIHPKTRVNRLNNNELENIYSNMKKIFSKAIMVNANIEKYPKQFIIPQRKKDGLCPIEDEPLKTIKCNGRTTYFCPIHQQLK